MPRLVNRTPKYRHHKATGQAVVTLNGRDFYLGRWQSAKSKREYARLTSQWLAAGGILVQTPAATLTIEQLLAAFWRHATTYYVDIEGKPTTEQRIFRTLIKQFRKAYGETLASEFGPLLPGRLTDKVSIQLPDGGSVDVKDLSPDVLRQHGVTFEIDSDYGDGRFHLITDAARMQVHFDSNRPSFITLSAKQASIPSAFLIELKDQRIAVRIERAELDKLIGKPDDVILKQFPPDR